MAVRITKVDVWAGELEDQPGGLARVLDALASGGARLQCCIARRQPDKPGRGIAFVTPVSGARAQDAAAARHGAGTNRDAPRPGSRRPGVGRAHPRRQQRRTCGVLGRRVA